MKPSMKPHMKTFNETLNDNPTWHPKESQTKPYMNLGEEAKTN